jgi:hypothetical protein
MGNTTRKSTALISLVLVPLNLLGLGFAGCDSRDDTPDFSQATNASDASPDDAENNVDFEDPADPFNLDPVPADNVPTTSGPVASAPTTQPLARSSFAALPPNHAMHSYHSGGGVLFVPIPFRSGYTPPYRPSPSFRTSSSSSVYRSSPSRSSDGSFSHSSGTSRGGFGSSAASHSASS